MCFNLFCQKKAQRGCPKCVNVRCFFSRYLGLTEIFLLEERLHPHCPSTISCWGWHSLILCVSRGSRTHCRKHRYSRGCVVGGYRNRNGNISNLGLFNRLNVLNKGLKHFFGAWSHMWPWRCQYVAMEGSPTNLYCSHPDVTGFWWLTCPTSLHIPLQVYS